MLCAFLIEVNAVVDHMELGRLADLVSQRRILLEFGNADDTVRDRCQHLLDHDIGPDQFLVGALHIKGPAVRVIDADVRLALPVLKANVRKTSDRPCLRTVAVDDIRLVLADQLPDFHDAAEIRARADRMMHIRDMFHLGDDVGKLSGVNGIRTHEDMLKLVTIILF